jgi:hypothetical protein
VRKNLRKVLEKEKMKSQSDTLKNELLDAFHNPHQTKFFLQNIWSKYDVQGNGTLSKHEAKHFVD